MGHKAVDGLSLNAEEHKVLALLGHNGAGKTTTINMLIGLLQPDEGRYFTMLELGVFEDWWSHPKEKEEYMHTVKPLYGGHVWGNYYDPCREFGCF